MKKILKIGFLLSVVGFFAYLVCSNFPFEYQDVARDSSLILFAMGWGLSLSGLVFRLGWKTVKKD